MGNENLSNKESLKLITEMINTAKGNIQNSYIFFLIWGWLVMLASLLHYGLINIYQPGTSGIGMVYCNNRFLFIRLVWIQIR